MKSKPTLRSLAAELGLSVTTVSRGLAGHDDVSPGTRERIRAAAERMGYVPNESARRLVTGRANAVGLVLPYPSDETYDPYVNDPFINELLRHVAHALQRLPQLDLIVSYAHRQHDMLDIYRRFAQGRRVDAFVLARTWEQDPRVDYLLDQGVPFVCHGRTERADEHAWVDTDARAGFADATRHLIALGHQRIVLLNLPLVYNTTRFRADGYSDAMRSAGLPVRITTCELRMQSGYEAALTHLQAPDPPTAFLCGTDIVASGAMRAVREMGLSPGRQVSVIGTDNLPLAHLHEPELASLAYSYEELGKVIVTMLEEQLAGKTIVPRHELVEFQLVVRNSVGPCVAR